ncbi:MAG: NUDIX domain-containing protein [Candidatus Jorgensenbacteria bacterium]
MEPKLFVATKAFIRNCDHVLLVRESSKYSDGTNAGKYDVPGGRLIPGQHFEEGLLREVREETGLAVQVEKPFFVNEWRPVVRGEQWQIVGIFFVCESDTDTVRLSDDHDDFLWIDPRKYTQYPLIENLKPAFESFLKNLVS